MPTYKVKPEPDYGVAVEAPKKKGKRYPSVSIPVSPEIIAALEVGGQVVVELKGTVRGLESRQSSDNDPWANRNELRMELRVVEAYAAEGDDDEEEKEPSMKDEIDKALGYKE
jgi:hypothetical protein